MSATTPGSSASGGLVAELAERVGPDPIELFAPYAGEAAALLLDAIAEAGDDRAAVTAAVFAADREIAPDPELVAAARGTP